MVSKPENYKKYRLVELITSLAQATRITESDALQEKLHDLRREGWELVDIFILKRAKLKKIMERKKVLKKKYKGSKENFDMCSLERKIHEMSKTLRALQIEMANMYTKIVDQNKKIRVRSKIHRKLQQRRIIKFAEFMVQYYSAQEIEKQMNIPVIDKSVELSLTDKADIMNDTEHITTDEIQMKIVDNAQKQERDVLELNKNKIDENNFDFISSEEEQENIMQNVESNRNIIDINEEQKEEFNIDTDLL